MRFILYFGTATHQRPEEARAPCPVAWHEMLAEMDEGLGGQVPLFSSFFIPSFIPPLRTRAGAVAGALVCWITWRSTMTTCHHSDTRSLQIPMLLSMIVLRPPGGSLQTGWSL